MVMAGGGAVTAHVGKKAVTSLLGTMSPSASVLALASVEVDLSVIPEGKNMLVKWRGKPLFVRHRSQEEIDSVREVNITTLRDPQEDADRVQQDKWLCTCNWFKCVLTWADFC